MKRIFSLLLVITLLLCACTSPEEPESGEAQEPVESVESSDLPEDVEEDEEPVEDGEGEESAEEVETSEEPPNVYNYKGIDFPGWYESESYFWVSTDVLEETEIGQRLFQDSYDAIMAFIANNTDELLKYFDDEYKQNQINYMNWIAENLKESGMKKTDRIDSLSYLGIRYLSSLIIDIESDNIYLYYSVIYTPPEHMFDIDMKIYLNENNEWKFANISYTDLAC